MRYSQEVKNEIRALRKKMVVRPEVCVERGKYFTESYKSTEGEPEVIRRAKALKHLFENISIRIDTDELIVGKMTSKQRGGALTPELRADWYVEELDSLSNRDIDCFQPISDAEKEVIKEIVPYWEGQSLQHRLYVRMTDECKLVDGLVMGGGYYCGNNQYYGHTSCDYGIIIQMGTLKMIEDIKGRMYDLRPDSIDDYHKNIEYQAMIIALEAINAYAFRYAKLAEEMAAQETDVVRKEELLLIADNCRTVPLYPAQTFHQAVQCTWFAYVAILNEGWGTGTGLMDPDAYLWPAYKKDRDAGILTDDMAYRLIAMLLIKSNEGIMCYSVKTARAYAGFAVAAAITLGGYTRDGQCKVNELSYVFLDAEEDVALSAEDITVRINEETPDEFLIRACEVAKKVSGKLKFLGDKAAMKQLVSDGRTIEQARRLALVGCTTPTIPGESLDAPGGIISVPMLLELALNNGKSRITGLQIGLETGNAREFTCYEQVWNALVKQMEYLYPYCRMINNLDKELFATYLPNPFQSTLCPICVARGQDVIRGGTAPNIVFAMSLMGTPNVADALYVIKHLVFEEKKLTMTQLLDACDKDFEGEEEILHMISHQPKYGNNIAEVDCFIDDIFTVSADIMKRAKCYLGAKPNIAGAAVTANVGMGNVVGALPDGRRSGTPLSEGGMSPYQGRNISGATATMMSLAQRDFMNMRHGVVLNMLFDPKALEGEENMKKFVSLLRTYFEQNGFLVQFNIVTTDTLRAAMKNPEQYRDLIVRVATYASYFVELGPELQHDIINRYEFERV